MPVDVDDYEPFHMERVRERMPTLVPFGIAIESFPAYANDSVDLHRLDVVLLTCVLAGRGRHVTGAADDEVVGPWVGVTRAGEPHSLVTGDATVDVVNVYLDLDGNPLPPLGAPLDDALAALIPFAASSAAAPALTQVRMDGTDDLRSVLDLLDRETARPREGSGDALDSLRCLLVTILARAVLDGGLIPPRRRLTPAEETIENVRAHLERTCLEPHSLASLAEMAHLERTYFSRVFSQRVGVTVSDYIARLRIHHAVQQLQTTDLPVAEIAASSGFHDLSHFGRTFQRITGTTPREYRRSHRSLRDL